MKKAAFIIFFGVCVLLLIEYITTPKSTSSDISEKYITPTPTTRHIDYRRSKSVIVDNIPYEYDISTPIDPASVLLIPNFSQKLTAKDVFDASSCSFLINGGFYTTDYKPIGLFSRNNETISDAQTNKLFDSFVFVNEDNKGFISFDEPYMFTQFAFQTGPMLIWDGSPVRLTIKDDEEARRMVLLHDESSFYFITVFDKDALYSGPLLSKLPSYISAIAKKHSINVKQATNLDGGSASTYISSATNLGEITTVGSFLCGK